MKTEQLYELIYKNDKPYGIRNESGFLVFFPSIFKYDKQEERYKDELSIQIGMAEFLTEKLNTEERL